VKLWLAALGLVALGGGPVGLLWWERLQQARHPDPNWIDPLR
jgi:hypothetical protein